jgi:DNA-3-methyladenine glycosylase II
MPAKSNRSQIMAVKRHFRKADPVMYAAITAMGWKPLPTPTQPREYFAKLCREIISQQLAGKAARAIIGRFEALFGGRVTPARVLARSETELRVIGMSWAKARYVRDLANKVQAKDVRLGKLHDLPDEAVIAELTKVKGVGRWTAEMFLIFTLAREDIFSFGDLGLRKGFIRLYPLKRVHTKKAMERITGTWKPYRSYASLALWHALDSKE